MSLVLGDIDKAAINAVTDKLTAALASAGPEATEAINAALDHFSVIGTALESKTMADFVQSVENPMLARMDAVTLQVTRLVDLAAPFASFSEGFQVVPIKSDEVVTVFLDIAAHACAAG
jgi:hypothetical protein